MHGKTCVYFGVLTHVCGGEGLDRKVGDLITEIVVMCHDEALLLAVKGVSDIKYHATSIKMFRQVGGIDAIVHKEGITTLLRP